MQERDIQPESEFAGEAAGTHLDACAFAGDAPALERCARERLAAEPDDRRALAWLVSARRLQGDLAGARNLLEEMARARPDSAVLWRELGGISRDLGQWDSAAAAFAKAVERDPGDARGWRLLGDALAKTGDTARAREAYLNSCGISLESLNALQHVSESEGGELAAFVARHPTDVCSELMLAEREVRLGRAGEAEVRLRRVLALSPDFALARYVLALILYRQTRSQETIRELDLLLKNDAGNAACLNLKALSLSHIGNYERSLACYDALLKEAPRSAPFWVGYGHVLKTVGQLQNAIGAFRKAIEVQPDLGDAWWQLADLKTFRFGPTEIKSMRKALANRALSPSNRAQIHFALGKALEDARDWARAFEEYAHGNAVRRQTIKYNPDATAALVRDSKALFTMTFFQSRWGAGAASADPIFIVGLTRSGSTLVEQILASHSAIEGTAELPAVNVLVARLRERYPDVPYPDLLGAVPASEFARLGEDYLEQARAHRKTNRPFFIDKMPGNFLHLGLLQLMLPNARIVDARRHPLACGFANFKQHFTHGQPWSYDLGEIGRYYRDYVELMAHFDAALPGRVHRVIYEQLIADAQAETKRLLDYCGLPFEPACLRFYENRRPVLTASAEQVRRPIFTDALEQWRNFEPWLAPLKRVLGDVLRAYPAAPRFADEEDAAP